MVNIRKTRKGTGVFILCKRSTIKSPLFVNVKFLG